MYVEISAWPWTSGVETCATIFQNSLILYLCFEGLLPNPIAITSQKQGRSSIITARAAVT